ncbi:MAG TPA: MATE family efflux transporter, partial [Humisphaera sp.]|nr:MATE family efflux transporter [Humisphaera sp.]
TALVGRYIGMGRPDIARKRADLGFAVTAAYMLTCGLIFCLGRYRLIAIFASDPQVLHIGEMLLIFAGVYQFFDAMYIVYNGALRGAGDTFIPAIATATLCWGLTVFGGYIVATRFTRWGAAGPWTVAMIYGMILGIFMATRFRRGKWKAIPSGKSEIRIPEIRIKSQ